MWGKGQDKGGGGPGPRPKPLAPEPQPKRRMTTEAPVPGCLRVKYNHPFGMILRTGVHSFHR